MPTPADAVELKIAETGHILPQAPKPVAAYVPTRLVGPLLYVSGQVPFRDGQLIARGPIPDACSLEQAQEAARQCVLNGLAAAKQALGSLERIRSVVRVGCWVQCVPGYPDQPKVANGASELLVEIFGDAGRHARAAVGATALPLDTSVEIEFLFEVAPD